MAKADQLDNPHSGLVTPEQEAESALSLGDAHATEALWTRLESLVTLLQQLHELHRRGFDQASTEGIEFYRASLEQARSQVRPDIPRRLCSLRELLRAHLRKAKSLAEAERQVDRLQEVFALILDRWVPDVYLVSFYEADPARPMWSIGPEHDPKRRELASIVADGMYHLREMRRWAAHLRPASITEARHHDDRELQPAEKPPRLRVDLDRRTVTLDGRVYEVDSVQALRWVKALQSREGSWVSGAELAQLDEELIDVRTDRLKNQLPDGIQALIESKSGRGSRLRLSPVA